MSDLYLKHHGVLGMKWGVRRYQNKDGTLTNTGKRRKEQAYRAIKQGKDGKASSGEKVFRNASDMTSNASHIVSKFGNKKYDYSNMSDQELRSKLNRIRMETEYSKITGDDTSKGKKVALDILDVAGSSLAIAASAASIATAIHFIRKG